MNPIWLLTQLVFFLGVWQLFLWYSAKGLWALQLKAEEKKQKEFRENRQT